MARDVQEEDIYTKTSKVESTKNYSILSSYQNLSTKKAYFNLFFVCECQKGCQKLIFTNKIAKMLFLRYTQKDHVHVTSILYFVEAISATLKSL